MKFYTPSWMRKDLIWTERPDELTRPSSELVYWLVGVFAMAMFIHIGNLPVWLTITLIIGIVMRVAMEHFRIHLSGTSVTSAAGIALAIAVYLNYRTVLGRDPGTALVAAFSLVKLYEMRWQRDMAFMVFSSYFLVTSGLLYSQGFELFMYCLVLYWLLTAVLFRTYCGDFPENNVTSMLYRSGRVLLTALPLAILLFFFCPRYAGTLQLRMNDATLGLTDTVSPGSFEDLLLDDTTAFRVTFVGGNPPPQDQMYWRAIVLAKYANNVWNVGDYAGRPTEVPAEYSGDKSKLIRQIITIWPHYHNWLFALDSIEWMPHQNNIELHNFRSVSLTRPRCVNNKITYEVDSIDRMALLAEKKKAGIGPSPEDIQLDKGFRGDDGKYTVFYDLLLEVPEAAKLDPRVLELAHQFDLPDHTTETCAQNILEYFHKNGFRYTTSPGMYGENELSDFLFNRRAGYCEHYASAFAVIMRLNKHPSRLVAGYFGGELNPLGGFYIIHQYDAHTWAEAWSRNQQAWLRYDPTLVISPAAVQMSSVSEVDDAGLTVRVGEERVTLFSPKWLPSDVNVWLKNFQYRRQLWEAEWDQLVMSYDSDAQQELTQTLSDSMAPTLTRVVMGAAAWIALILYLIFRPKLKTDPIERSYIRLCETLARLGFKREPWESPLAYAERAGSSLPTAAPEILEICRTVSLARYHPPVEPPPAHIGKKLGSLLTSLEKKLRSAYIPS